MSDCRHSRNGCNTIPRWPRAARRSSARCSNTKRCVSGQPVKARQLHPDVASDNPAAASQMALVNEAWVVLEDPLARRAYDAQTGESVPFPPAWSPDELEAPPGFILFDEGMGVSGWYYRAADGSRRALSLTATTDDLSGLRELPDDGLWKLALIRQKIVDSDLVLLGRFHELESLLLARTKISDAGLRHLGVLSKLRELDLAYCRVTDAGVVTLRALESLEELILFETRVTDEGVRELAFHPQLAVLDLRGTKVKGDCLPALVSLPHLRELRLPRNAKQAARRFQELRPDVAIL